MDRKFLEQFGLEKSAVDSIMQVNGEDIERHKRRAQAAEMNREALEEQLAQSREALGQYEDVDVAGLRQEAQRLQTEMEARQAEFDRQMAEHRFRAMFESEAGAAGARNSKAVAALLDMEALRGSENPAQELRKAMKELLQSDGYLFAQQEATPLCVSTGSSHAEPGETEVDAFTAAAMKGAGLKQAQD